MQEVEILILGAGWTSTFLIPLLEDRKVTFAATTTTGRDSTIPFRFDPSSTDPSYFSALPPARTILITFPLIGLKQSKLLTSSYTSTHSTGSSSKPRFIQLGSTGIFQGIPDQPLWITRHSPYNKRNDRAIAEDELIALGGCVLSLSGLWGGSRQPRDWVDRVASTKEKAREKKSLHMIHGDDVSRAILAVHENWAFAEGQRWMLTDGFVYDWWALFAGWAGTASDKRGNGAEGVESAENAEKNQTEQSRWVYELMWENDIKALPRSMEELGRCYDSREFWHKAGITPTHARI